MHQKNLSIIELIEQGESLCLEFKSDIKSLPDRELIAALVALTNTEGGSLLLGVEDDGRVTGLHPNHIAIQRLPALVANKTNSPISIKVITHQVQDHILAQIIVPKSRYLVSLAPRIVTSSRWLRCAGVWPAMLRCCPGGVFYPATKARLRVSRMQQTKHDSLYLPPNAQIPFIEGFKGGSSNRDYGRVNAHL